MSSISSLGHATPAKPEGAFAAPAVRRGLFLAAALLALYLLFFQGLAKRDLWSSHEARAAMDAQTILDGGVWGMPRLFDGRDELQKPPLYYWLVALIAWVRGGPVDAWAARLPAALAALGCVLLLAAFGRARGRLRVGVLSGAVLATAVHFTWLARVGRIDMPLTLTTSVAVAAFHVAPARRARLAGYLALAAGVMLKGPIGLVLPASVLVARRLPDHWLRRRAPDRSACRVPRAALPSLFWGVPLVLALTLPWFLWANRETGGEFFRVFLWHHNFERGLGTAELRSHAWWLYLPYFFVDFLPWSPLLAPAGWLAVRRGWLRDDAEMRLGLVWLLAVVGVLSVASFKRGDYLLPAYPGAALFLGCVLERWRREPPLETCPRNGRSKILRFSAEYATPLLVAVVLALVAGWVVRVNWWLPAHEAYRDYAAFAALVRRAAPPSEEVVFFRTEAHALAFHVGKPLRVLSAWEELDDYLARPGTRHVVMPPESAAESAGRLPGVRLETVARNTDLAGGRHERPLVLLRSH